MFKETIHLSRPLKIVKWDEKEMSQSKNKNKSPSSWHKESRESTGQWINEKDELLIHAQNIVVEQSKVKQSEEIKILLQLISQSITKHISEQREIIHQFESRIGVISVAIAKKIIQKEVSIDPDIIRRTLQEAIAKLNNENKIIIQLNPVDKMTIEKVWNEIAKTKEGSAEWALEENPAISQGGCVIKTEHGIIDAEIDSQLDLIERMLSERIGNSYEKPQKPLNKHQNEC